MRRRWRIARLIVPIAAALTVTAVSLAGSAQASTTRDFLVTLYGWPDNSPPGDGTAFGSGHAGGTGTYADPVTFATDQDELAPGTKVYYPFLHRYFVMQDECVECDQDWANGKSHIDLWVGGQGANTSAVINCEDGLTKDSASVIVDPPTNEPVDTTPLFNARTDSCYNPDSFNGGAAPPSPRGGAAPSNGTLTPRSSSGRPTARSSSETPTARSSSGSPRPTGSGGVPTALAQGGTPIHGYRKCVDVSGANTTNGTAIQLWTCNGTNAQKFMYTGNTLQVLGKCLDVTAAGTADGTKVQLYDCNGSNAQAWTVNGTQLINVASGKCLDATDKRTADGTRLQIWSCWGGLNQQWNIG